LRALVFTGTRRLEWHDAPDPVITGGRQAVVRPIASTTCDLDQRIIAGKAPFEPPFAIGHECVAEVVEIGSSVRSVKPGDVVVVPWHFSCGECDRCRAGLTASCQAIGRYACFGIPIGGHWGGLFSDLALVPFADAMLVPVPEGVDPVAAVSVSDNLTDAWIGVSKGLARHPGAKVLVHGGVGSLGVYAVQLALAAGAESVDYVDGDASRRAVARSLARPALQGQQDRTRTVRLTAHVRARQRPQLRLLLSACNQRRPTRHDNYPSNVNTGPKLPFVRAAGEACLGV